jgi:GT2 family glycosyltransferase
MEQMCTMVCSDPIEQNNMPKISVIIINYNGKDVVIDCLRSLEKQTWKDFEIIVVDNGSSDDSVKDIRHFLEQCALAGRIKLIPLERNHGFTGGNIRGLEQAQAEYVALLNNDAEADKDWLENLFTTMERNPHVGICASKIIAFGTNVIDSAGDGYSTLLKGFKRGEGEDRASFNVQEPVFGGCAGAVLYRRKMLEEIGFFDDDFFLIHEDTDLNFRAQRTGWKILYVPSAIVYHKVRSTIGIMSDTAVYYTMRNNEFVRIKNIPLSLLFRNLPLLVAGMLTEFFYFAVKHGKLILYLKAKRDVIKSLKIMLRKRKQVRDMARVDTTYLRSQLTPVVNRAFLLPRIKKFFFS